MTIPKFVQTHFLHGTAAATANRGEDNNPKRIVMGDVLRTRTSSQRFKRDLATTESIHSIYNIPGAQEDYRSREFVTKMIIPTLRQEGVSTEVLDAIEEPLNVNLYGSENAGDRKNRQSLLLGRPEVDFLTQVAREVCQENPDDPEAAQAAVNLRFSRERRNFDAMRKACQIPHGMRAAAFGRMMTAHPEANIDGAVYVAHLMGVHPMESEVDYFSTVDDLNRDDDEPGAAYLGNSQLHSTLFYGYLVIDVPGLVGNLEAVERKEWLQADRTMAGEMVHQIIMSVATISPGAKKGSTADFSRPPFIMVEIGDEQPRSLMEAFRKPVHSGQVDDTLQAMAQYLENLDRRFDQQEVRQFSSDIRQPMPGAQEVDRVKAIAEWARDAVQKGQA